MLRKTLKWVGVAALLLLATFVGLLVSRAYRSADMTGDLAAGPPEEVLRLAFGSCNRRDLPQDYWAVIAATAPDAWVWLGDNIYGDTEDMKLLATKYDEQKNAPEYAAFRERVPAVYGIYDDHDYGSNDAGAGWPHRAAARDLMLEFLDVPREDPVWNREGGYQAYDLEGSGVTVKLILLDTRYFRDDFAPASAEGQRYGINEKGDILGEAQWTWLEEQLMDEAADAILVGSSIQVLPVDHAYEKWALFPAARARLLDLVTRASRSTAGGAGERPVLMLSGDRHLAEYTVVDSNGVRYDELTSSSLTHGYDNPDEPNRYRVGENIGIENFGLVHVYRDEGDITLGGSILATEDGRPLKTMVIDPAPPAVLRDAQKYTIRNFMAYELKPCPDSPNCVSTKAARADKKRDPIPYDGTPAEAKAQLKRAIGQMKRTELVKEDGNYLHYTFRTWPIPFTDDVEFIIDADEKVIHYRSASRVGYSDMGVNSKRMARIVDAYVNDN